MKYIKKVENIDEKIIEKIAKSTKCSKEFAEILTNRGLIEVKEIKSFLNPKESDYINANNFAEMNKCVQIIKKHLDMKSNILIFGDYDVDGVCASTIMLKALENYNGAKNIFVHIPDRNKEGYGIKKDYVLEIAKLNVGLVITVDNGIVANEAIEDLKAIGVDVIITDHHEPENILPTADAIINPKVRKSGYPFKDICGSVVALKIGEALNGYNFRKQYLDLACLATIADNMPMVNENRWIVREGINLIKNNKLICELAKMNGANKIKYASDLAFSVIPSLNACGRLKTANLAFQYVLNSKEIDTPTQKTKQLCEAIYNINKTRKAEQAEAIADIEQNDRIINKDADILVSIQKNINKGLIGIVAGKIASTKHKPTMSFVYDEENKIYCGSGRSVEGFNMISEIRKYSNLLKEIGGHEGAIGITVEEEKWNSFIDKINKITFKNKNEECIKYDIETNLATLTSDNFKKEIEQLEPYGLENEEVLFLIKDCYFANVGQFANKHFKSELIDNSKKVYVTGFFKDAPEAGNIRYNNEVILNKENLIVDYTQIEQEIEKQYEFGKDKRDLSNLNISQAKIKQLNNKEIYTIEDLLNYFPSKYVDYRHPKNVAQIKQENLIKTDISIIGTIKKINKGNKAIILDCEDEANFIFKVVFYFQPYVEKMVKLGGKMIFCGICDYFYGSDIIQIAPKYFSYNIDELKKMIPVYKKITGMSQEYLSKTIKTAIDNAIAEDYLEEELVKKYNLETESTMYKQLHMPDNEDDIKNGVERRIFDKLFYFCLNFNEQNKDIIEKNNILLKNSKSWNNLEKLLPYKMTDDQKNVINNLRLIGKSGKRINSLIQGGVGSGKTTIALFGAALACDNGYQSAIVAPTEVLASQHYQEFKNYFDKLGYKVMFLSGSLKQKEKKNVWKAIKEGTVDVVVGTHALFSKEVSFKNLGFVCVDEEHKFGVKQRNRLLELAKKPHFISMSATPIPRTLCMCYYGDTIDVQTIKTKPSNRKEIITKIIEKDEEINNFMLEEIKKGHQCYVVCPMIEESEKMINVNSAKDTFEKMDKYYKKISENVNIGIINGKMKKDEITKTIEDFKNNKINILVSTTIVEVGVNIPNATVMVIKSSERFGLASMHQLRGRVGRSNLQSYCILQPGCNDAGSEILCKTNDGFEIAKQDAIIRGPGDFIGVEQSGKNDIIEIMLNNEELYKKINNETKEIVKNDKRKEKYKDFFRES